jgi:hypothetical protein
MQTIMDPQAVRQFARDLRQRADDLGRINGQASAASISMQDTWRDAKYDAFLRLLDEATLEIRNFCDYAARYADHLDKKAGGVERYLEDRY